MKAVITAILFLLHVCCSAQGGITIVDPKDFSITAEPEEANFEFYSRKLGVNTKASYTAVKKRMMPTNAGTVTYTPTPAGNVVARRGLVVRTTSGDVWYIDGFGVGTKLSSGTQSANYPPYDSDQQAAANCVGIYRVTANNPYGLQTGTLRVRQFGGVVNCQ
jgi:hypothetical protein